MDKIQKILIVTDDKKLKSVLEFCFDGWGYNVFFEESPEPDIAKIIKIAPDVVVVDVHYATHERLKICDILKTDFATTHVPVITLINKRHLSHQLLGLRLGVDDYLIKPPDPVELKVRIEMALKRSVQSYYASPLTGLPGSTVIEDILRDRIAKSSNFVAGHIDIDNFKSYNDKYGYLKGDRVIMQTAYMLATTVRKLGNKDDFVGHIGGDDFVVVTTADKYHQICRNFICMFDTISLFHYSEEDRKSGHISVKDRQGILRKLALMSVTIALVQKTGPLEITSIIELNERIAEVKQYLKKIPGSKYLADRRGKRTDHLTVQVFANEEKLMARYRPLGQILLGENLVTGDQLDNALKVHWKSGTQLGEVLRDLGFISEKKLDEALTLQEKALEIVSTR